MTEHALLSASGANIWLNCPPSIRLGEDQPDTTSIYAREGTLAHAVAELKARRLFEEITPEEYQAEIDALITSDEWGKVEAEIGSPDLFSEIDRHTNYYEENLKRLSIEMPFKPAALIENKVDFSMYAPHGFGTADCILAAGHQLTVIDFKYGRGIAVEANNNPQLSLYGLGAYQLLRMLYDLKKVSLVIIQPRSESGAKFSQWDQTIDELLSFGEKVKPLAKQAWDGEGEFNPGDHCRYCKAKGFCRARADENVKLAGFTELKPNSLSLEELDKYLKAGESVSAWLKDLKDYTLKQCLAGKNVPGWKAVAGRRSRSWTDQLHAFEVLQSKGIDESMLYERKPLSVAKTEKLIGEKLYKEIEPDLVTISEGKPTLAPESDKRDAITQVPTAKEVFS